MFDGEDAEKTWWEYMVKTKVIAEKYKWVSAIESNVVNPTTKEQKAAEAAGKHWFVMTCKGERPCNTYIFITTKEAYEIFGTK
jgi:hypothetical protein